MAKMTLAELTKSLQNKSSTYGWDALTLYDQRKANELLQQLYVERFNTEDGYIEPASIVASWGDGSYKEHIFNLKFSSPRLSFEQSSPELDPRARLTLNMVGGMIVTTAAALGGVVYVKRIMQVLPVNSPQLWMDQPITKGNVNGVGDVIIDLDQADTFMATFVIGDLAQDDVGRRFKEYFNSLPAAQKKFSLGTIDGHVNGVLTPKNFEIKVMKSAPAALLNDSEYGDGAVMLFITMEGGTAGTSFPSASATYLIPADEEGHKFTGSMLLSSRLLAEKILKPALEKSIGNGLILQLSDTGSDAASTLKASAGGGDITERVVYKYWMNGAEWGYEADAFSKLNPLRFEFSNTANDNYGFGITYGEGGASIELSWSNSLPGKCEVDTVAIDDPENVDFTCTFNIALSLKLNLDVETNNVKFSEVTIVSENYEVAFASKPVVPWNLDGEAVTKKFITESIRGAVRNTLDDIEIPDIDTFLLRNLLFPGHNALQLTAASVPGDLAVFGQIDPLRTTSVIAPINSTIEAGSTLQFSLLPLPADITWTVRDVDGENDQAGSCSSTGLYQAPTQDQIKEGAITVVVTAKGTLNGQPVQSSALVSVLHSAIQINPLYSSCDTNNTSVLEATALSGETLEWVIETPQWGSTLSKVEGNPALRVYTAGDVKDTEVPYPIDKIKVTDKKNNVSAVFYVCINKILTTMPVAMDESSTPEKGSVKFNLIGNKGPVESGPQLTWSVLEGPGAIDPVTGVYTEPAELIPGSFVVVMAAYDLDVIFLYGSLAIPLPLSKYAELAGQVSNTVLSTHAEFVAKKSNTVRGQ